MMPGCPPVEAIAQLATMQPGEVDEAVADHARSCVACRGLVEEQRETRALVGRLGAPALTAARRAALAAEVMARSDLQDAAPDEEVPLPERSHRASFAIVGFAAAAALAALLLPRGGDDAPAPVAPAPIAAPIVLAPAPASIAPAPVDEPPAPTVSVPASRQATVRGATAEFVWTHRGEADDDVVQLREGALAVDAIDARPVQIVAGEIRVGVARARADVKARRGVIQTVTVIAGSVEVIASGKRHIIEAGMTWERPAEAKPPALTSPGSVGAESIDSAAVALAAFREGWTALRDGRHREAIAAFDRATDPVVAEDATYWAAVATERAGDHEAAANRFAAFAARFPRSPRAGSATAAADRLRAPSR